MAFYPNTEKKNPVSQAEAGRSITNVLHAAEVGGADAARPMPGVIGKLSGYMGAAAAFVVGAAAEEETPAATGVDRV